LFYIKKVNSFKTSRRTCGNCRLHFRPCPYTYTKWGMSANKNWNTRNNCGQSITYVFFFLRKEQAAEPHSERRNWSRIPV